MIPMTTYQSWTNTRYQDTNHAFNVNSKRKIPFQQISVQINHKVEHFIFLVCLKSLHFVRNFFEVYLAVKDQKANERYICETATS